MRIHAVFSSISMFAIPWSGASTRAQDLARAVPGAKLSELRRPALVVLDIGEEDQPFERKVRDETLREGGCVRMRGESRPGLRKRTWGQDRAPPLCERAAVHRIPPSR